MRQLGALGRYPSRARAPSPLVSSLAATCKSDVPYHKVIGKSIATDILPRQQEIVGTDSQLSSHTLNRGEPADLSAPATVDSPLGYRRFWFNLGQVDEMLDDSCNYY